MQICSWLPIFISVMALVISAVTAYLIFRPESPLIFARIIEHGTESQDTNIRRRELRLLQKTDPSLWLVYKICTSKKWLSRIVEPKWNKYGEMEDYSQDGDWRKCILFDTPVKEDSVLLHPDAPSTLLLSCFVVKRNRPFFRCIFRRKVWVIPEQ